VFWYLDFGPQNLFRLVGILLSAAITSHFDLFTEGWTRRIRISLPQCDAMLVRGIALVVESAILAEYNPKIVSCVLHRVRVLQALTIWRPIFVHYAVLIRPVGILNGS
jgi:hypothetical protein